MKSLLRRYGRLCLPQNRRFLIVPHSTFIFAGTDTTSNIMSRILHLLAEHPTVQAKLREEVSLAKDLYGSELSYDQLNGLGYLDGICRETLRLCAFSPSLCVITYTVFCCRHTAVNFALR